MATFPYASDLGTHSYKQIVEFARNSGISFSVSSDYRPGAVTVSGNKSLHAYGNADDLVSSPQSMQALAAWFEQYSPYILELIHSGGKGYFVKNGKIVDAAYYGATIVSQHYNHVHIGMTLSGLAAAKGGGVKPVSNVTTPAEGTVQGCLAQAGKAAAVFLLATPQLITLWDCVSRFH